MTSFVAGATGYTGREVVRLLRERGERVFAHVRPDSHRLEEWRRRYTEIGAELDATPWQSDALRTRLAEIAPERVFALLGTTRKRARQEGMANAGRAYHEIDYGLTVLLLRAVEQAGISARFVYLSSIGARGGTGNAYLRARGRVEEELSTSRVPYTIARPSFITGADRDDGRPMERVAARVADSLLGVVGVLGARRLRDRYRSTTNTELAAALVRLAIDAATVNRIVESEELQELAKRSQ
jgi:uncharacterized protein YbjT (DUF2867 family)